MNRDEAKEYIKNQLEFYLRGKGINTGRNFKCPFCGGGDHTPPMSYNDKTKQIHCFSCERTADIFDLIGHEYNLTEPKDQFEKAYDLFHITIDGSKPLPNKQREQETAKNDNKIQIYPLSEGAAKYLESRGFGDSTVKAAGIGCNRSGTELIIPYPNSNYYVSRSITEKKYRYPKGKEIQLYNENALYNEKGEPVFIVEGQFDALSIIALGYAAVGLGGTANISRLMSVLEEKPTKNPLILALDNDEAGRKAQERATEKLKEVEVFFIIGNITETRSGTKYKDANEIMVADIDRFAANLLKASENAVDIKAMEEEKTAAEYRKNSTREQIPALLEEIKRRKNIPGISTGFPVLDKTLGGGLYEGLYILGAISSLGKTTFALQIADYIASQGRDVIVFSLEMSRYELMAKSLSRETARAAEELKIKPGYARTARNILQYDIVGGEQAAVFQRAVERYKSIAEHHFIGEGIGNFGIVQIRKAVEDHHKNTGIYPVIFIDYLQILAPLDPKATDKQNTDKAVTELKRLSRDCNIPVFAISSLNRASYKDKIEMAAFKESGAIEYSSDALLGLELNGAGEKNFDIDAAKKKNPREILLKVLKHRNGRTGDYIGFKYNAYFNTFTETGIAEQKTAPTKGA